MSTTLPVQSVDAEHPWLGLSPFTETTKSFFFGRDHEIRDIFLRVREQSLTVLFGQSGLGKTSLLGAGLIPKLKVEGFRPVLVRLGYDLTDPPLIEQVFQAVRTARSSTEANDSGREGTAVLSTLWETFHHVPSRTRDLVESPPVLIFDQFEEIFTLTQTRERQREAEELFRQLADLIENRPPGPVQERLLTDRRLAREYDLAGSSMRIVITLREDYLSQLEGWKKVMPALMRNRMALHLLNGPQALEAVVRPGRFGGRDLVSDAVGTRIVCFVARRPPGTSLNEIGAVPPLLSLLCDELNATRLATGMSSITEDQVESQSADILLNFYARSFNGLHPAVRRFVEDRMVTVGGHRNPVAREDAIADLQASGVTNPAFALDQLIQGRLLSTEDRGGLQRVEITHDVLAPLAVRSRDERKVREAKEQSDREAVENRKRLRRARLAAMMYGTLTLISMIAGGWAWRAQGIASAAKQNAENAQSVAEKREKEANDAEKIALKAKDDLTYQVYDNSIAIAEREISQNHDIGKAGALLEGQNCPLRLRGWEWHYLMRLRDGGHVPLEDPQAGGNSHQTGLWDAEFSPDGSLIATCSIDGTLKFWNAQSGKLIRRIDADNILGYADFWEALGLHRFPLFYLPLKIWCASSEQFIRNIALDKTFGWSRILPALGIPRIPIMSVAFSPDGKQIATASFLPQAKFDRRHPFNVKPDRYSPGLVRIWDVATGKLLSGFQDQKGIVLTLTYSPDGKRIVSASINSDFSFVVWDVKTNRVIKRVLGHTSHVHRLKYSQNGRLLAASETDGHVKLWDASTFEERLTILAHPAPVINLAFAPPDGKVFATCGEDGLLRIWETATGKMVRELEGHAGSALDVRYSPDGKRIASAGFDKTVRLWDAETGKAKLTLRGHRELVFSVAFSPDGQRLVSASFDRTARIWDATPRTESLNPGEFVLGGHTDRVNSVALSRDNKYLASGGWDTTIRVWDAQTGAFLSKMEGHTGAIWNVVFSPDGQRVASASWDRTARIWDRQSGRELLTLSENNAPLQSIAFSPDGTRVVTSGTDGQIRIWDSVTGKVLTTCDGFIFPVFAVAFSPDGKRVASGGSDRAVKIWDADTGMNLLSLTGHTASIYSLAFSPDGKRVVSGSWDQNVCVWDVTLGSGSTRNRVPLYLKGPDRPKTHQDRVNGVAFSGDGTRIATSSEDKTVRLWDSKTGLEIAPPHLHRDFVWSVVFTSDGKRLISGSWEKDKWIRAWNIEQQSQ
ncbi:MAG: NTPase-like protein [Planctomycetaceae bacterium]|nr:NTPase-like protein [Planctomycetaceae bacterium]